MHQIIKILPKQRQTMLFSATQVREAEEHRQAGSMTWQSAEQQVAVTAVNHPTCSCVMVGV